MGAVFIVGGDGMILTDICRNQDFNAFTSTVLTSGGSTQV